MTVVKVLDDILSTSGCVNLVDIRAYGKELRLASNDYIVPHKYLHPEVGRHKHWRMRVAEQEVGEYGELLKDAISVKDDELSSCIYRHVSKNSDRANCDFYLVKCTKDNIRESDFLKVISNILIRYALRKEEYQNIDEKNALEIARKAVERFTKSPSTGEVGEIILFALLESERAAPQLVNKMALKTDGEVHVFGLDGIHMGVWNDEIRMYYGESKFRKSHSRSITEAINDLEKFHNDLKDEEFEITLVSNNIDFSKFGDNLDKIKKLLDPYTPDKSFLRTVYAVFVGFNWESLEKIDFGIIQDGIRAVLEGRIEEHSPKILDSCSSKVKNSGIDILVEFFFIPFKDVEKFREDFLGVIG